MICSSPTRSAPSNRTRAASRPRRSAASTRDPTRREVHRLAGQRAQEEAWHRYATQPFPGGPLTASLTFLEAAELSGNLSRGSSAAWAALSGTHWQTAAYLSLARTGPRDRRRLPGR